MSARQSHRRRSVIAAVVVVAAAAVALIAVSATGGDAAAPAAGSSAPVVGPVTGLERRQADDPLALGRTDAPVVMVAYSDFQCPFCGKFARDTEPTLVQKYVDTGILRIEWRDFPYLGADSTTAAYAGRAAAAQGKFWQFHDAAYAKEFRPNSGALSASNLDAIATALGLDLTRFHADMASGTVHTAVEDDFVGGQQIGVSGTPAFIVNGTPVIGAQPLATFEQTIDAAAGPAA